MGDVSARKPSAFAEHPKRSPQRQFSLLAFLLLLLGASPGSAGTFTVFGPQNYLRDTGKPVAVTNDFSVLNPNTEYSIQVKNDGVASAVISVNDIEVLSPDDFNENVASITVPVQLNTSNTIAVELRGKPGGSLTIEIIGIDNEPPVIVASATPAPNSNGWNNSNVTVTFTCTDAISGVAVCPSPVVVTSEGAAQVVTGTAVDRAGNSATASVTINLDKTPPSIAASGSPPANAAGWNNSDVTVSFTCTDALSGVQSCSPPVRVSTEGRNQVITGTATDKADNSATASITINLDKTPPAVAITSPSPGAVVNTSALILTGTATDALSGIATVTCNGIAARVTSSSFTCDLTLNLGLNSILVEATDIAGNRGSATTSVTFVPPPVLQSANPNTGQQGQSLSVTITGKFTHFVQGTTQASFGAGIVVGGGAAGAFGPVTVTSATSATAQLVIEAAAAVGSRTVSVQTGAEQESLANGFTVQGGTPVLLSVAPNAGQPGQTLSVTITGQFTHFVQGASRAIFGAGVAVGGGTPGGFGPVTVNSPTIATAQLVIDAAAAVGSRTVSVQTGAERESLTNGFTVQAPPTPVLTAVNPSSGQQGHSLAVTITGQFTHFAEGSTRASFGASIAVGGGASGAFGPVTVGSPTSANAQIAIDAAATIGSRTVTVQTGAEQESLANGFTVAQTIRTPVVKITSPDPFTLFRQGPITVNGTVDNPQDTVVVNGVAAAVISGAFNAINVPLHEGPNILTATATDPAGNVGTASITVSLGATPPRINIDTPPDGMVTNSPSITVTGMINAVVIGTVNADQVTVTVNGINAQVANRRYLVPAVPLTRGANTINAVGTDKVGNTASARVTVNFVPVPTQPTISLVSGNNQSGVIATRLPSPIVVALKDSAGNPVAGKPAIFQVMEDQGTLTGPSGEVRSLAVTSDSQGRAQAFWTLGMRSGAGNNMAKATAVGFAGMVEFTASVQPGAPARISLDAGNNQVGVAGQPLTRPLVGIVTDAGHNRLANVPVTFTVKQGGGTINGQPSLTVNTDGDGRALAVLTLGLQEGTDNNLVQANFPNNAGAPITFVASGRASGNAAATKITGVVLDNTDVPVPGVTMRVPGTNLSTRADDQGQFVLQPAPVGTLKLIADGSTATRPGTWPSLEYDLVTISGQNNTIGMPIHLLPLDIPHGLLVDSTHGGTVTIPDVPGFSLTIAPGSATFPDGSKRGVISVTLVHADKIPMVPNFGQQPRFIVSIQPAGTHFSPPAPMSIPNVDGLRPSEVTEMYSFDHDLGQFVSIGTGTVSDDGMVIHSDPGVGIIKGGWHCGGNPAGIGTCEHECDDGNDCTKDTLVNGMCVHTAEPKDTPCRDANKSSQVACGTGKVNVSVDSSCRGKCNGTADANACQNSPFGIKQMEDAVASLVGKVCDSCINDANGLRATMQSNLKKNGVQIFCADDLTANPGACAETGVGGGKTTVAKRQVTAGEPCATIPLAQDLLHEVVHGAGKKGDEPTPIGCEVACYGNPVTRGGIVGDAANCK